MEKLCFKHPCIRVTCIAPWLAIRVSFLINIIMILVVTFFPSLSAMSRTILYVFQRGKESSHFYYHMPPFTFKRIIAECDYHANKNDTDIWGKLIYRSV